MSEKPKVGLVIAAYNEAQVIRATCEDLLKNAPSWTPIVVDDGSADRTSDELNGLPVVLLKHPINLGQGAALQTGMEYARRAQFDCVVTFDADGQHRIEDAQAMVKQLSESGCDIILGSRFLSEESHAQMPQKKQWVLKLAVLFTRLTTGLKLTDTHNGLRALSRKAMESIQITQNGMSHASEILEQIAEKKLSYQEAPTLIHYTEYSMSKGQKISNSLNILWDTFTRRMKQ